MKGLLLLLFFIITRTVAAQELPGLVAIWKMDGNCELTDASAVLPSNGVLTDISLSADRGNTPNKALSFNLTTSYISLGAVTKLKLPGDKSISFWINPVLTGSNHTGSVFSYGTGMAIKYEEQSGLVRLNVTFGNTSYMVVNLVPNQWQMITITFKKDFSSAKSEAIYYANGIQVTQSQQDKTAQDFTNSIALIGAAGPANLTNGFRGSLDDIRIYDRALSASEILNLVLPVTLEFFKAKSANGFIELSWKTQLEENVDHFDLQKSMDGINFKKISQVNAGKFNYLAYDLSGGPAQHTWYRLVIVDRDGKTAYSNVIRITTGDIPNEPEIKLFPNPGSRYINIIGATGNGTISFINNAGMLVKQKKFSSSDAVDVSDLMPGIYYIILFDGNKRMTSKFNKR